MAGGPHFEIFDAADGVRWRTQAANGRYDGHSEQSFRDDADAERAIRDHVHTVLVATRMIGAAKKPPADIAIERVKVPADPPPVEEPAAPEAEDTNASGNGTG
jgi:hypothetical protein